MTTIADALIPVLALILVGFVIQRTGFLPPHVLALGRKTDLFPADAGYPDP